MLAEEILEAIRRIHEAPLAADGWDAALPSIAAVTGSDVALMLVQDVRSGAEEYVTAVGMAPEHMAGFALAARAGKIPDWAQAMPVGTVVQSSSAMPNREFMRSEFYNEAIRPIGTFHGLGVKPLNTPHRRVFITPGRRLGRDDFDRTDVAAMQTLVPHIVTALHIGSRLAAADLAAGAVAALDRLETAVILVDATGKVVFANRIADALLVDARVLCTKGRHIMACDPQTNMALLRELACCTENDEIARARKHVLDLPRRDGRTSLRMIVSPFRLDSLGIDISTFGGHRPAAMIMIADPDRERHARKERLRSEFGLTAAEADVALEIINGDGRDATAMRLGITVATVRTHLVRIFEKTGVRRQAQLVRLVLQGRNGTDRG